MQFPRLLLPMILSVLVGIQALQAQPDTPTVSGAIKPITEANASQIEALVSLVWEVRDVSVSPDGSLIAVSGDYYASNYVIDIYDFATGEKISSMQGRMDFFRNLVWSPDSRKIAVVGGRTTGGGAEVWSVHTYTVALGTNPSYYIVGNSDAWYNDSVFSSDTPGNPVLVAWNPTSDLIAVAFNRRLDIYNTVRDEALISHPTEGVTALEWSSDGRLITTRNADRTVTLWGVPDPQG